MEFPKEYPRMLGTAAVVRDAAGRILLHLRNKPPDQGRWELFGTYVKPRELVVDAVKRRLQEHAGIGEAKAIRFTGRYYDAPERNPGLYCVALAFEVIIDPKAATNMKECRWVTRDELGFLDIIPHDKEVIAEML